MTIARTRASIGALMMVACSGAAERPAPFSGPADPAAPAAIGFEMPEGAEPATPASADAKLCNEGATRSCKVMLPKHGSIESCFVGVQLCVGDGWSECGDEEALFSEYFGEP